MILSTTNSGLYKHVTNTVRFQSDEKGLLSYWNSI